MGGRCVDLMDVINQWFRENFANILCAVGGAFVYFIMSDEKPLFRRLLSTIAGFVIAIIFAPPFCQYFNIIEYDYAIAATMALGGRWVAESILEVGKRFKRGQFGE